MGPLGHPWFRHLRLPFNLLLSPIYLWGVFLAEGTLRDPRFWLGYVSLHLFLYGGGTAFNSYYDRDEGPIGGMAVPPPVDRGLLWFSLLWQGLGLPLAVAVGRSFTAAWLLIFLLMAAYSHPAIRLKSNPLLAMGAVALGQGGVGFVVGWLVPRPAPGSLLAPVPLVGIAAAALIVSGLYIVTQSYQTAEDRARGDRTLPVLLGAGRALRVALLFLGSGGALLILFLFPQVGPLWSGALTLFFGASGIALLRWSRAYDERRIMENFGRAMRFAALNSAVLSLFLLAQLV